MRPSLRTRGAAVAVAILAAVCAAAASAHAGTDAPLTVSVAGIGRSAVPSSFVGISTEIRDVPVYAGTTTANLDQPFLQLLRNLTDGGTPILRLGGDSTDWTWWPVPGMERPGGVTYALSPAWTAVAKAVAAAIGGKLTIGINFEANSRRVAAYETQQLDAQLGSSVAAYELGNEPELYAGFPWYLAPDRTPVYGRGADFTENALTANFAGIASALPNVPLEGPSTGSLAWFDGLGGFLVRNHRRLSVVTVHDYPLDHCGHDTNRPSYLLRESSLEGLVSALQPAVAAAHRFGLPIRVDEMNSVACEGENGVTNSFAAALWALNLLPMLAQSGVVGVNFHTVPNTPQALINATDYTHAGWRASVQSEYYALLAFDAAAPAGSHFLGIHATTTPDLWEWATRAPDGTVHVVLSNATSAARTVSLAVEHRSAAGTASILDAPSIGATTGITLGGQTISHATGSLTGTAQTVAVPAARGGRYTLTVPASSAVIFTIPS